MLVGLRFSLGTKTPIAYKDLQTCILYKPSRTCVDAAMCLALKGWQGGKDGLWRPLECNRPCPLRFHLRPGGLGRRTGLVHGERCQFRQGGRENRHQSTLAANGALAPPDQEAKAVVEQIATNHPAKRLWVGLGSIGCPSYLLPPLLWGSGAPCCYTTALLCRLDGGGTWTVCRYIYTK